MAADGSKFGTCCESLREAMAGEDFEPLIATGDDGILYMSVGLAEMEDKETGMIDHPIFFCPFCGSQLQTPEEVDAKGGGAS
ncbi:MAG TPA: hypothetical protein PK970_08495 [Hyphomicrobiaceae bacterium]|nr:hypothetical protein [Hyphomicrobiaceae bacterium]